MTIKRFTLSSQPASVTYTAQSLAYAIKMSGASGTKLTVSAQGYTVKQGFFILILDLLENPAVADSEVRAVFKSLTDNSAAADAAILAFSAAKSDATATTDEQILSVFKALADTALATDLATHSVVKPATDAFNATEIQSASLNKTAADTVNATDDLDGEASILDDQEMQFVKSRSDLATTTDNFSRQVNYSRAPSDTFSAVDIATLAPEKFFSDTGNATDSVDFFDTSKSISDASQASDNAVRQTASSLTDSAAASDAHTAVQGKELSDTGSATDSVDFFATNKAATDTGYVSESTALSTGNALSDPAVTTDIFSSQRNFSRSFNESASPTDVSEIQFSASQSDSAFVSENIDILLIIALSFTETPALTDVGSLRNQGFVDFTYFAEDFVGASRTFT